MTRAKSVEDIINAVKNGAVVEVNFEKKRRHLVKDGVRIATIAFDLWTELCDGCRLQATHMSNNGDWRYTVKS